MKGFSKYLILLFSFSALISCDSNEEKEGDKTLYTCSMHPQIIQDEPGNCPICGMDLTPVSSGAQDTSNAIMLSETQMLLANIKTDTITLKPIGDEVLLTATTVVNPNANEEVSSRVNGRIEQLYVRNPGQLIKAGNLLYRIYSEELLAAQTEYLLAKESAAKFPSGKTDFKGLMEAARTKMLLWGMTEGQINNLNKSNITATIPIYSKRNGTITEINVTEGSYVMEGSTVLKLIDLSSVWIEAQVYPNETRDLKVGQTVEVRFPSVAGRISGKVVFINPELERNTKLNLIRVEVSNPNLSYHPGMQAYVAIRQSKKYTMVVPTDAVIQDKMGAMVWVQTGTGTFERRMVHIGIQSNGLTEIEMGLKEGDVVVVSGAYLLNSEYILQKGSDPHAGMDM